MFPHFLENAGPLYKEVRELMATIWEVLETAFGKLKEELYDGVAVKLVNADQPSMVETDSRVLEVRAVLLQSDGEEEYPTLF